MGYYTNYTLEIHATKDNGLNIINKMSEELENDKFYPFEFELEDILESDNKNLLKLEGSEAKWYDHEEEMRELSRSFPTTLFELHREGEENGDVWDKYFLNGKMQECYAEMTIPPYDESKLR